MKKLLSLAILFLSLSSQASLREFECNMVAASGYEFGVMQYNLEDKVLSYFYKDGRFVRSNVTGSGSCQALKGNYCIYTEKIQGVINHTLTFNDQELEDFLNGKTDLIKGWIFDELVFSKIPLNLECGPLYF